MKFITVILATAAVVLAQDTVSATGASCEPHGDHWHCPSGVAEPTTPPAESTASATGTSSVSNSESAGASTTATATACEPHGDHWHCPSGVAEPTTPPPASSTGEHDHDEDEDEDDHDHDHDHEHDHEDGFSATAATCMPHGDHWHCPSGVAEPTTPPSQTTGATTVSVSNTADAAASTPSESEGAAVINSQVEGVKMAAVGILGLLVL